MWVGTLPRRETESGRATVKYKDCWGEGSTGLYLNGNLVDRADDSYNLKTTTVSFRDNDELKFQDDGGNAVIWIGSIDYSCQEGALL